MSLDSPIPITVSGGSLGGGSSAFSRISGLVGFLGSIAFLYYLVSIIFKGKLTFVSEIPFLDLTSISLLH